MLAIILLLEFLSFKGQISNNTRRSVHCFIDSVIILYSYTLYVCFFSFMLPIGQVPEKVSLKLRISFLFYCYFLPRSFFRFLMKAYEMRNDISHKRDKKYFKYTFFVTTLSDSLTEHHRYLTDIFCCFLQT